MSNQETDFKEFCRKARSEWLAAKKKVEDGCPHLQGSNPLSVGTGYPFAPSIAWHYFDDHVIRGVCTNCLKVIEPGDSDYYLLTRRQSNMMSACGSETETVPLTKEVQAEIDSQFCDLDRYYTPQSEQSIKDFIKNELLKEFVDQLYNEYRKNLKP